MIFPALTLAVTLLSILMSLSIPDVSLKLTSKHTFRFSSKFILKLFLSIAIWGMLVVISFPISDSNQIDNSIQILIITEFCIPLAIVYLSVHKLKITKKYIKIDVSRIEFEECSKFSDNITCYKIYLCNDIEFMKHIKKNSIIENESSFDLGRLYIKESGLWLFEDRLAVKRTINDVIDNTTLRIINETKNYDYKIDSINNGYVISSEFLPFVSMNWRIIRKSNTVKELTSDIRSIIIAYYKLCNVESIRKQKLLNYDVREHHKFELIDQILRSTKINHGANFDFNIDNDQVYGANMLMEYGLIYSESGYDCRSTVLGNKTTEFGFQKAQEYNNAKEKEKKVEKRLHITMQASIWAVIIAFGALLAAVLTLLRQLEIV